MVNRSLLRLSSLVPTSFGFVRGILETEGDWHAGNAPPAEEISGAPPEQTGRTTDDAVAKSVMNVALDLVLSEIAHQARSITNAAGSAVLLIREGIPVCRSTSGATAREASALLSECSGLAWRNGAPQYCHDVETDSRFDVAPFRRLGIRSFLIVPVQDDKEAVVAILQTFSARPEALSDRDLLALQGLGHHVVDHLEAAERSFASVPKLIGQANSAREKKTLPSPAQWFNTARLTFAREQKNLTLGILCIALAILLGWTIGRRERESARQSRWSSTAPAINHSQIAVTSADSNSTQVANLTTAATGPWTDASEVNAKGEQSPSKNENHRSRVKSRRSLVSAVTPSGGSSSDLVIFDSGRQIFPMKSLQSHPLSDAPPNSETRQSKPKSDDHETPVSISEQVAEEHLLKRIEPDYPESAREQHLQGTVILNVNVGKDGAVHSLSRVAGDSQLALLAAKAVRQWKFAPLIHDGAPVIFESQVTLSFALP